MDNSRPSVKPYWPLDRHTVTWAVPWDPKKTIDRQEDEWCEDMHLRELFCKTVCVLLWLKADEITNGPRYLKEDYSDNEDQWRWRQYRESAEKYNERLVTIAYSRNVKQVIHELEQSHPILKGKYWRKILSLLLLRTDIHPLLDHWDFLKNIWENQGK